MGFNLDALQPVTYHASGKFSAVVRTNEGRRPVLHQELRQSCQPIIGVEPACKRNRQALATELVDDAKHFEWSPSDWAVGHEIIRLHVLGRRWPQPDTSTVVEPQAPALRLPGRYFKPCAPPDTLPPLGLDSPARGAHQRGDTTIAIAPILTGQTDNRRAQRSLIIAHPAWLARGGTRLTDGATGAPF
jgi:hypothetical protein